MRIADRHDGLLLAGLALAGFIVFGPTIQYLLQAAHEVEVRHGVSLMPALVILTAIFVFHQSLKRQEVNTRAAMAAAEAAQARARAGDLERLVSFGDALARALTFDALREAVWRNLPRIAGDAEAWLFVRNADAWQELVGGTGAAGDTIRAAMAVPGALEGGAARGVGGATCFPLRVGDQVVGALAIVEGPRFEPAMRQLLAAAVPLLAIAVRNVQLFAETRESATRDRLTGCYNRPQTVELLDGELRRAARSRLPLTLVMFDIDNFKQINDQHGHLAGDAVLAAIGQRLGETLRRSDHRCRYGGDEFLVVLPETPAHAAVIVAESIRREVQSLAIATEQGVVHPTASVGVAHARTGELEVPALISRADAALYRAKRAGRNCVRVDELACDSADAAVFAALPTASVRPS